MRIALVRLAAAVAGCLASLAIAAPWAPNETQASPQADLFDYEFSVARGQLVWNDVAGNLWLANVDRASGLFAPPSGKGLLVDPDSMTFDDAQKTKNGPEWLQTASGDVIVHTKYAGRHTD